MRPDKQYSFHLVPGLYNNPWYTDHSPICMDIMCNSPFQRNGDSKLFNLPKKFRWDDVKKHEFVKTINSIEFRSKLMALSCGTGHLSCNTASSGRINQVSSKSC